MNLNIPSVEYNHTFRANLDKLVIDGKGNEDFKKLIDNHGLDKINYFTIKKDLNVFSVDLKTGAFHLNGVPIINIELGLTTKDKNGNIIKFDENKLKRDLIYFRRVKHNFKPDGTVETEQKPCIGWKTKFDNKVYQKLLFLNSDGSFTLSDKK